MAWPRRSRASPGSAPPRLMGKRLIPSAHALGWRSGAPVGGSASDAVRACRGILLFILCGPPPTSASLRLLSPSPSPVSSELVSPRDGHQGAAGLAQGLFVFRGGDAVGDDAGAGLHVDLARGEDRGAQGDAGVEVAAEVEVAHRD